VFTQTWPAPGVPLVTGAGQGDAFLPKIPLSGFFAVGLGTGVGVATVTGEVAGSALFFARGFFGVPSGEVAAMGVGEVTAAGEGEGLALFFARVFFGVPSGAALVAGLEAGEGLAFSVFFARRCFGLADGVGVCE
jgi:hypothetical protein